MAYFLAKAAATKKPMADWVGYRRRGSENDKSGGECGGAEAKAGAGVGADVRRAEKPETVRSGAKQRFGERGRMESPFRAQVDELQKKQTCVRRGGDSI